MREHRGQAIRAGPFLDSSGLTSAAHRLGPSVLMLEDVEATEKPGPRPHRCNDRIEDFLQVRLSWQPTVTGGCMWHRHEHWGYIAAGSVHSGTAESAPCTGAAVVLPQLKAGVGGGGGARMLICIM